MKLSQFSLSLFSALFILGGCQTVPEDPTDIKKALDEAIEEHDTPKGVKPLTAIPNAVQQELMEQDSQSSRHSMVAEKRLEISAQDIEARDFFTAIAQDSPYSIAVHPDVEGRITLNLSDVTLIEAMAVIEEVYGYEVRRDKRVIQVYPAGLRTETLPLNYLFIKRYGQSSSKVNSGGVSENDENSGSSNDSSNNSSSNSNSSSSSSNSETTSGVNISTENESDFWTELKDTLKELVGNEPGRVVFVSPQAGLVTVKGLPREIDAVKKFLADTESQLHRQVIIEAKIMEVTLEDNYQQGINWQEVTTNAGSVDIGFQSSGNIIGDVISTAIGGTTSLSFSGSDFTSVIELLQTQGNVQVLSSPRITATNNQKALIKVGEDEYFVTEVSSTTVTGVSSSVSPEIQLTPFFSGIALDVTPQIDDKGEVILHIHPSVTVTDEQTKSITLGDQDIVLPLAQSNVRESDTVIRAKSGEIVVIGGLMETRKVSGESKVPLLGDIPFIGGLFKSKTESLRKTELVILLKPIVVGQDTWKTQLQDARSILTEWFPEESEGDEGEETSGNESTTKVNE